MKNHRKQCINKYGNVRKIYFAEKAGKISPYIHKPSADLKKYYHFLIRITENSSPPDCFMYSYLERIIANNVNFTAQEVKILFLLHDFGMDPNAPDFGKSFRRSNFTFCPAYTLSRYIPGVVELFKRICPNVKLTIYISHQAELNLPPKGGPVLRRALRFESAKPFPELQKTSMYYPLNNDFLEMFDLMQYFNLSFHEEVNFPAQAMLYNCAIPFDPKIRKRFVRDLCQLQNGGMIVIDNPEFNHAPFLTKHDFRDSKDLAKKFMPDHYPLAWEGRNLQEALAFLERHRYVVLKPSFLSNADKIYFFNLLKAKDDAETAEMKEKFIEAFQIIQSISGSERIIVQRFSRGIFKHGEKRVYALNGKILPFAIKMVQKDPDLPFKPDFGAESFPVILEEEEIRVMKKLTEKLRPLNSYLLGVDITRDIEDDGSERIVMFEANFISPGFFPRIAAATETRRAEIDELMAALPEDLHKFMEINPVESMLHKPLLRHLRTTEARSGQNPREKIKALRGTFMQDPGLAA